MTNTQLKPSRMTNIELKPKLPYTSIVKSTAPGDVLGMLSR